MNTHTITPLEHAALVERARQLTIQRRLKEAAAIYRRIKETTHQALKAGTKKGNGK